MTDGLVDFVRDRLDEDEQVARAAPGPSWERRQIRGTFDESVVFENYVAVADPDRNNVVLADVAEEVLLFVLRHDPARVLAEVEAKRRIIDEIVPDIHDTEAALDEDKGSPSDPPRIWADEMLLRLLALPYREHPDYQPEWAPDEG